jgi:hypothetical protein
VFERGQRGQRCRSDDYVVDPLSNSEVRANAKRLRHFLKLTDAERIDPLIMEQVTEIWTVRGVKPFHLKVVADIDLPDSGLTSYDLSSLVVQIPRRIRHDAFMGDGYARYTIAHELGHATLHLDKLTQGATMPRRQIGNVSLAWIPKFRSAEHQAMVFGAAFLINDELARRLSSPDEISVQAGVSLAAAKTFFEQVQEEMNRSAMADNLRELAKQIAPRHAASASPAFLDELCSCCGQKTLFPVGHKFMCQACDTVYDRFQDGDSVE